MPTIITRRCFALVAAGVLTGAAGARAPASDHGAALAAIERRVGGRLGVYALDTGTGGVLAHRADERFLLCSSMKGVLAAAVLARVDRGSDSLSGRIAYAEHDLLPASPVTTAGVAAGSLSIGELCAAILRVSDNTAANLLLARIGGPAALTAFVREQGDRVTRFDRYETALGVRAGVLDTTTPRAIGTVARRLVLGHVLSPRMRAQLFAWMVDNRVGLTRLKASLPSHWTVGDRTGTGDGLCADYGIARRPGRAPLIMAAYHDAPLLGLPEQEAVLRDVGRVIAGWAG